MAQRRMFSLKVVDTDTFLDMSPSAQNLYFHLGMRADDDGFVSNPRKIMKITGAPEDDMRVLVAKNFIIPMSTNGVCVVTHWKVNNLIKSDRYTETIYKEEKDGVYSVDLLGGSKMVPQLEPQDRLGKDRLGKDTTHTESQSDSKVIAEVINLFQEVNPSFGKWFGNKTQRTAVDRLLVIHGFEKVKGVISILPRTNTIAYFPTITTPVQLEDGWAKLRSKLEQEKNKSITKGRGVA